MTKRKRFSLLVLVMLECDRERFFPIFPRLCCVLPNKNEWSIFLFRSHFFFHCKLSSLIFCSIFPFHFPPQLFDYTVSCCVWNANTHHTNKQKKAYFFLWKKCKPVSPIRCSSKVKPQENFTRSSKSFNQKDKIHISTESNDLLFLFLFLFSHVRGEKKWELCSQRKKKPWKNFYGTRYNNKKKKHFQFSLCLLFLCFLCVCWMLVSLISCERDF